MINPKVKLINSYADKESGISGVEIATSFGVFSGTAYVHPEDAIYFSNFVGCQLAEYRAYLKMMQYIIRDFKSQYRGLEKYYKIISGMRDFDPDSIPASKCRRQLREYKAEIRYWEDQKTEIEKAIQTCIETHNELLKKYRQIDEEFANNEKYD